MHTKTGLQAFYTVGELSRILPMSDQTLRRYFDAGIIRGKRIGPAKRRLVGLDALIDFLREHKVPCTDPRLAAEAKVGAPS